MAQKLILPINDCKLTASMGTKAYKDKFGFSHYGVDMVSEKNSTIIHGSGDGIVVAAGNDNVVGNVLVIRYANAISPKTGYACDIIFRYFHLNKIEVRKEQLIDKHTILGQYGNTGMLIMNSHLHLESDKDTAHPLFSPTVKRSSFLKGSAEGANAKTVENPIEWLYCRTGEPDYQSYTTAKDIYIRTEDMAIVLI